DLVQVLHRDSGVGARLGRRRDRVLVHGQADRPVVLAWRRGQADLLGGVCEGRLEHDALLPRHLVTDEPAALTGLRRGPSGHDEVAVDLTTELTLARSGHSGSPSLVPVCLM